MRKRLLRLPHLNQKLSPEYVTFTIVGGVKQWQNGCGLRIHIEHHVSLLLIHMPDVWTTNPQKLRDAIQSTGAECGVEPRVLKPRDKEWTCHIHAENISYDIYIHPVEKLYLHPFFINHLIILAISKGS